MKREEIESVKMVIKEAPIIGSHVETEAGAGNLVEEAPPVVIDIDKQTMDISEEAPLIVRDVDVLAQLQESSYEKQCSVLWEK